MNRLTFNIILVSFIVSFAACNNIKDNTSKSIFQKYSPVSKEYKNKLAAELKLDAEHLIYTFNKYYENEGQEYLDIQVKGDDFVAKGLVLDNNWNKLEGIKRTKGQGYSGAELRGLKLYIEENPSGATLIYKDLQKIID